MTTTQDRERFGTPGPWEVDSGMVQTVAEHECKTPGCGVHIPIAYMDRKPGNGTLPCERDANARLIAAAPELLAALKRITPLFSEAFDDLNDCDDSGEHEVVMLARAAIAKAEGRAA